MSFLLKKSVGKISKAMLDVERYRGIEWAQRLRAEASENLTQIKNGALSG
ncbi:hypothetical protein THO17_19990 [Marinomonas sp. THO17]